MSSSELSDWPSEDDVPSLQRPMFKSKSDEKEWERKQRNREYRVASRREKRTRKADEKKQRKLNATILRRMTKNPEKYNKNVDRNRFRDIELERRKIYRGAVSQAERLAAIYDPSGKLFNVGPVITQEDGRVVSVEYLERKARAQAERAAKHAQINSSEAAAHQAAKLAEPDMNQVVFTTPIDVQDGLNPEIRELIQPSSNIKGNTKGLSKTQQKKLALFEERPPPPKPVIPEGIELPEGEENWLALWDLSADQIELRLKREKKRKVVERKALREKQKAGKVERRAARDERRKVYREKKQEWKAIKEVEKQQKRKLLRVEQEEAKRVETDVNLAERRKAMQVCAELGFTLENVEGVADIKPKAQGMKGQEVDYSIIEIGGRPSEIKIKDEKIAMEIKERASKSSKQTNRVDLGKVADESKTQALTTNGAHPADLGGDFVSLGSGGGVMGGQEYEPLNFNHKMRRKLHRAIEAAQIQKELLVRSTAKEHCVLNGIPVPPELAIEYQPIKLSGRRMLEDGTLETGKNERVRKRLELAEYNKAAKVLRRQAKAEAIEAGLRVFADLTKKRSIKTEKTPAPKLESIIETVVSTHEDLRHDGQEKLKDSKKRIRNDEPSTKNLKRSKTLVV